MDTAFVKKPSLTRPRSTVATLPAARTSDRLLHVEGNVVAAREVVGSSHGQKAQNHVPVGQRARDCADRSVSSTDDDEPAALGDRFVHDLRKPDRVVHGKGGEGEPCPAQFMLGVVIETLAPAGRGVDHKHGPPVLCEPCLKLLPFDVTRVVRGRAHQTAPLASERLLCPPCVFPGLSSRVTQTRSRDAPVSRQHELERSEAE